VIDARDRRVASGSRSGRVRGLSGRSPVTAKLFELRPPGFQIEARAIDGQNETVYRFTRLSDGWSVTARVLDVATMATMAVERPEELARQLISVLLGTSTDHSGRYLPLTQTRTPSAPAAATFRRLARALKVEPVKLMAQPTSWCWRGPLHNRRHDRDHRSPDPGCDGVEHSSFGRTIRVAREAAALQAPVVRCWDTRLSVAATLAD
jgi:hypothetical protein